MKVSSTVGRLGAAIAAALALAACGGSVDILLEKDLDVSSAVNAGVITVPVDLAAEAPGAWKHRSKIDSVAVTVAEAEVTELLTGNTAAAVSGEVWLLPDGALAPGAGAVQVGDFTDQPVAVGTVITLVASPALNAFVEQVFKGTGRFTVYAQGVGALGEVVACRLHVTLAANVKWSVI